MVFINLRRLRCWIFSASTTCMYVNCRVMSSYRATHRTSERVLEGTDKANKSENSKTTNYTCILLYVSRHCDFCIASPCLVHYWTKYCLARRGGRGGNHMGGGGGELEPHVHLGLHHVISLQCSAVLVFFQKERGEMRGEMKGECFFRPVTNSWIFFSLRIGPEEHFRFPIFSSYV